MCEAAVRFCGVGTVRHLAPDPSFAESDPLASPPVDPTVECPELTELAVLANAVFLQPFIARRLSETLDRNRTLEPETYELAEMLAGTDPRAGLDDLLSKLQPDLSRLAAARALRRRPS